MKSGHKIGKPAPLFTKIEQAQLDELKKKYGGSQADTKKAENKPLASLKNVKEAEAAIAEQGNKVRTLKSSGAEKSVVTEQVNILLALKKQLTELQQTESKPAGAINTVKDAEAAIAEQGNKVRAIKASGAEKSAVTEQVNILLALKKQLADLQLASTNAASAANGVAASSINKVAEIEAEIIKQGEKVRELKAKGDKNVWQPEVDRLLELKKQLVAAGGSPAPAPQSSGKNKKKK